MGNKYQLKAVSLAVISDIWYSAQFKHKCLRVIQCKVLVLCYIVIAEAGYHSSTSNRERELNKDIPEALHGFTQQPHKHSNCIYLNSEWVTLLKLAQRGQLFKFHIKEKCSLVSSIEIVAIWMLSYYVII